MTEYAYRDPRTGAWVGPFSTRDVAANTMLTRNPECGDWGNTAPILAQRDGQCVIDPNSVVAFRYEISPPYDFKQINHDWAMMAKARTA